MEQGVKRALTNAEIILSPVADGGDCFAEILAEALEADKKVLSLTGPLGSSISTAIYISREHSLAIIETATIAGLALISPKDRNPLITTTIGVGEAILIALDAGVRRIVIGLGGSATNDAGVGMLTALGVRFFNHNDELVKANGGSLRDITKIDTGDIDKRLADVIIDVACDVDNPFYGENGAAQIYAPQKGANPQEVKKLDDGMRHFAQLVNHTLGTDISNRPRAGAAGGLGGALFAFCGAKLSNGIDLVLDTIKFNETLKNTSLVLTAEGLLDGQTQQGKAPLGVAIRARQFNVPCIVLAGGISSASYFINRSDFTAAFSICPGPVSLKMSMEQAFDFLSNTTEQVVRTFVAGK